MSKSQYLTVQALTKYIKRKFDYDPHLQDIYVKGEISNYKKHSSGHLYFTLKDDKARILAVMFSAQARKVKFDLENGMNVLIRGEVSVYEPSGQYQIYVKEIEPDGIGALYLAFEQLKEKLEKEGLFDRKYKKKIPQFPQTVGVITSPTGAAIRDIITTIKRRFPAAKIMIYPALVQGDQAGPSTAASIKMANERKEADVLIVGRGGGSIEELWAFNEEQVARAIFQSEIPIISAVGHETDTTIADFVADLRAPTPTGAAEMAVPHIEELLERLLNRKIRLMRVIKEKINAENERLNRLQKSYAFRYPKKLYAQKMEQLDRTVERSKLILKRIAKENDERYILLKRRLNRQHPFTKVKQANDVLTDHSRRMNRAFEKKLRDKQKEYVSLLQTLEALSPLRIMERGYSIIYNEDGTLIKHVADVTDGQKLDVTLSDGIIHVAVEGKEKK